jgi:hypothetical protein
MQVKVLYDFDGEPNSSELTIRAGEFLTVSRHPKNIQNFEIGL